MPNYSNGHAQSVQRTADSILRAFGSACIALRLPGAAASDSPSAATAAQLGLGPVPTEDVVITPALVRPKGLAAASGAQQYELLLSACAVSKVITGRGFASAAALFNSALGAVVEGALLRIQSFNAEMLGPTAVLYRLSVSE